jgi:hypothetical protein
VTRRWLEDYRAPDPPATSAPSLRPTVRPGPRDRQLPRPRQTQPFLRGPIPAAWLARVPRSPRGAVASVWASLVVWYVAGLFGRETALPLSPRRHGRVLGVPRQTLQRGLRQLEVHGLIQVHRRPRGNTLVTILPVVGPRLSGSPR